MRACEDQSVTKAEALTLFGLSEASDEAARKAAFRTAIKAARPDQPGGDETRFRRLIAAWAVLQADQRVIPLPFAAPAHEPILSLTPMQAIGGGIAEMILQGQTVRVRFPAGARTGDRVSLGDAHTASIIIRSTDSVSAVGDDLYMEWPVSLRLIEDGGRLEIETWAGPRGVWVTPGQPSLRLRIEGLGLPARPDRAQGHLFVTLKPTAQAASPAETLLSQFARNWTNDRHAA